MLYLNLTPADEFGVRGNTSDAVARLEKSKVGCVSDFPKTAARKARGNRVHLGERHRVSVNVSRPLAGPQEPDGRLAAFVRCALLGWHPTRLKPFEVMMDDEKAAALLAAGRLLQSKDWFWGRREIKRMPGEKYPAAVLRVIQTLDAEERAKLRELTEWVRDYEKADAL